MNRRLTLLAFLGLILSLTSTSRSQTSFYGPYGVTRPGFAPYAGAGYIYNAPSYRIGWSATSYRLDAGYGRIGRSPAYLSTTRAPRLNHIQPYYQSAYRIDRGPSFGVSPPPVYRPLQTHSLTLYPGYHTTYHLGAVYRPYVTTSQYVYTPTYRSLTYSPMTSPYGAVYGAYGYSAVYGY